MTADVRPADPVAAVTHPDPYPYYADLAEPVHYRPSANTRVPVF
jgi:hypothetical protein